jgi:phosphodiesterase/alkaline phosphatase D-like protein
MKPLLWIVIISFIIMSSCKKAEVPVVITNDVTIITTNSAVSGGKITGDGGAKIITQGICWNTVPDPVTSDNKTTEAGSESFTSNISNLSPNTQYYVRAYASNEAGTGYGQNVTFKTAGDMPVSSSLDATNVQTISATLNGNVIPNFLSTEITFEFGTSSQYGTSITLSEPVPADNNSHPVHADITGLTPGTLYHFRIKAVNSLGTTFSNNLTFTTLGQKPSVKTNPVTNAGENSVTLNALVNPNHLLTQVSFEWGTTTSYGNTAAPGQNNMTGSSERNIFVSLSGLERGTIYHYRIKAVNELGTTYGSDVQFTTLAEPAVKTVYFSTGIASAIAGGDITNDFGLEITERGICWSPYPEPDLLNDNKLTSATSDKQFSASITGLNPNTIYYVRAYAKNSQGTGYGEDVIIKTYTGTVSDTEGNSYFTVTIGGQIWMAENLKSKKFLNGDPVNTTTVNLETADSPVFQWAFDNNEVNVSGYGRLYTWHAVAQRMSLRVCESWFLGVLVSWCLGVMLCGP